MIKPIRVKKAFTLIELMLVIILISTVSFLSMSSFNFNSQEKYKVSLENIKEFMLKNFKYEKKLTLSCIEDDGLECFIFIDEDINREIKIENLFLKIPQVYNYDKDLSDYSFSQVRIEDIDYEPFFELEINSDKKHKNIVVDTNNEKVYLFSTLKKSPEVFIGTNEIINRFLDLEVEVKDAF